MNQLISDFSLDKNKMTKILLAMIISLLVFSITYVEGLKAYNIITCAFPKEHRELNSIAFAYWFSNGNNPYSISLLEQENPIITNQYGIVSPLIWSFFIKLFSHTKLNAIQICELVTLLFELLSIIFTYKTIKNKTDNTILSLTGSLFICACMWRYTAFGGAYPDQIGIATLMALTLITSLNEKKKSFSTGLYAFLLVLLFYIKSYFMLISIGVFIYVLEHTSIKQTLRFVFDCAVFGLFSIFIVNFLFPLYFTEVLALGRGQSMSIFSYSISQLIRLLRSPFLVFSVSLIAYLMIIIIKSTIKKEPNNRSIIFRNIISHLKSFEGNILIFTLPFIVYIAMNDGTYNTYYLQLWFPFFIVLGCDILNELYNLISVKKPFYKYLVFILFILTTTKSIMYLSNYVLDEHYTSDYITAWDEAYKFGTDNIVTGNIYVPSYLGILALDNNLYISDYGQAEFNYSYNYKDYSEDNIWNRLFPSNKEIIKKNENYNDKLFDNISLAYYDYLIVEDSSDSINTNMLKLLNDSSNYKLEFTNVLITGKQKHEVTFWKKINSNSIGE